MDVITCENVAIVFLDLQEEIGKSNRTIAPDRLVRCTRALADLAALHALPVFASAVPPGGAFLRGVLEALPDLSVRMRTQASAVTNALAVVVKRSSTERVLDRDREHACRAWAMRAPPPCLCALWRYTAGEDVQKPAAFAVYAEAGIFTNFATHKRDLKCSSFGGAPFGLAKAVVGRGIGAHDERHCGRAFAPDRCDLDETAIFHARYYRQDTFDRKICSIGRRFRNGRPAAGARIRRTRRRSEPRPGHSRSVTLEWHYR